MRVLAFTASSGPVWTNLWILNSVGLECYPYKVEVTGSIPVESTKFFEIFRTMVKNYSYNGYFIYN